MRAPIDAVRSRADDTNEIGAAPPRNEKSLHVEVSAIDVATRQQ